MQVYSGGSTRTKGNSAFQTLAVKSNSIKIGTMVPAIDKTFQAIISKHYLEQDDLCVLYVL